MKLLLHLLRHYRRPLASALALTTLTALYGASRLEFEDNFRELFKSQHEHYARLDRLAEVFGAGDSICMILVEASDVMSRPALEVVHQIHLRCQQLDGVNSVASIYSARQKRRVGRYLLPLIPDPDMSDERLARAAQEVVEHPLLRGRLISEDRQATFIVVRLRGDDLTISALEDMLTRLRDVLRACTRDSTVDARLTGIPVIRVEGVRQLQRDHVRITLAGIALATLVAWLLLRRVAAVLIVVFPPVVGVLWTLGALGLAGKSLDVINVVLPALVLVIGVTDAVHLMFHFRRKLAEGERTDDSAWDAVRQLAGACFMTSLTTAIGFGSLAVSREQVIRDFAVFAALGVGLNFLAVITLFPLLASSPLGRRCRGRAERPRWSNRVLARVMRRIERYPFRTACGGILLTLLALWTAVHLETDYQLLENHTRDSQSYQTLRRCERLFGGLPLLHVVVEWPENESPRLPALLAVLDELHEILQRSPVSSAPLSIRTLLESLPGETDEARWRSLQYVPAEAVRAVFRADQRQALVSANVPDAGAAALREPLRQIESQLSEVQHRHPGFTLHLTGYAYMTTFRTSEMIQDLAKSLGLATIVIFAVIAFEFRSLTWGLISLFPNAFPLLATAALMVLLRYPLQYASVLAFSICLGIAVDDTIHFLSRFRRELRDHGRHPGAVRRTFVVISPVLVTTTLLMLSGFVSGFASSMPTMHAFAGFSCAALGFALCGDLIILPALLLCVYRLRRRGGGSTTTL